MPLATRPNETFEYVLSTDKHLPEKEQPVFLFRYISTLEWQEISKLSDKFEETADAEAMLDIAYEIINKVLVDWKKMIKQDGKEIPFDLKKLRGMLSLQEATELMFAAVSQRPSLEDKKKFDLQSDSSTRRRARTVKARKRARKSRRK